MPTFLAGLRPRLFHKVLLVLVATSLASMLLFAVVAHWYTTRTFLRYLNDERDQSVAALVDELAVIHARDGDWHALTSDRRAWHRLLRAALRVAPSEIDAGFDPLDDRPPGPGPEHPASPQAGAPGDFDLHGGDGPPPPRSAEGEPTPRMDGEAPGPRPGDGDMMSRRPDGPPPPGRPPHRHLRLPPRLQPTLYDVDHRIVAGAVPYNERMRLRPVEVAGRTVGFVGVAPLERPARASDKRFARRLLRVFTIAAAAVFLLSVVVSMVAARQLTRPILRIGETTRALAAGQFATRVEVHGSDEIAGLGEDVNLLARSLQENESARRRFFADVSHELRTPLAIMRGEIESVQDGIRPVDRALIDSLGQETARLTRLVEDLYQLARADIGALEYEFERASLGAIVTEAINRFANRWQQSGLAYEYALDAELCALVDRRRLLELLENLFENSCRYTDAPGQLRITLTRSGNSAHLLVEDSAPGVAAEDLGRLFEPLERAEGSRSRAHGGAGLGLAICKRIVAAHGGRIDARPSPLGGLAFDVELPLTG